MSSFIHNYVQNRVVRPEKSGFVAPLDHDGADIAVVLTALTLVAHEPLLHPAARHQAQDAIDRLGPTASENVRRHVGNWVQNRMIEGLRALYRGDGSMPLTYSPIVNEAGRRTLQHLADGGAGDSAMAEGLRAAIATSDNAAIMRFVRQSPAPHLPEVDDQYHPEGA